MMCYHQIVAASARDVRGLEVLVDGHSLVERSPLGIGDNAGFRPTLRPFSSAGEQPTVTAPGTHCTGLELGAFRSRARCVVVVQGLTN